MRSEFTVGDASDESGADSAIRHVGDTAFLIAACRAVESARPDAFFRDPLAERLSGEKGKAILEAFPGNKITKWMTAIRTVIIDDYIRAAIARGVDTVVNLGAGLDTRPYRLDLPPTLTWIEADYPEMIAFKEERLRDEHPRCRVERVPVDLSDATLRREFLADIVARGGRVLFLTEGVVPYLSNEDAGALADDLHTVPNVDAWIVDFISGESHMYRVRGGIRKHMKDAPFRFKPDDWVAFFEAHGWRRSDIRYLAVEGKKMGRRFPMPLVPRVLIFITRKFTRKRRQGFTQFAGYAVLTPIT
jgi:methyltransferase (TIGR00027 family)